MNKAKQKMLEKKGWKVGTAKEFLGLSPAESRCIELKSTLSKSGSGHTLGTPWAHENESENDTFGLSRRVMGGSSFTCGVFLRGMYPRRGYFYGGM
jgi:hypothetical protein